MLQAGCKFPEDRIVVAECEPGYLGRYVRHGLEICYNNYQGDPDELRNTMVHELVHAYDECRGKNFDWTNCRHIACSEVRGRHCTIRKLESQSYFTDSVLLRVFFMIFVLALHLHCSTAACTSWSLMSIDSDSRAQTVPHRSADTGCQA